MLERNFLAHVRLSLLLSLLSSAIHYEFACRAWTPPKDHQPSIPRQLFLSSLEFAAAMLVIAVGVWQYASSARDMRRMQAVLAATTVSSSNHLGKGPFALT